MLPIRTSIRPIKTPYMNYSLIVANVVVFFITFGSDGLWPWARVYMLTPVRPFLWQFVTYAFLHGSFMHIAGNMYFLYIFGNNVNDRLGNLGYLVFYLGGAVFSALGHMLAASLFGGGSVAVPVLGASGAVAAVTGAYLVLFPRTLITIVYWFILIGTMDLPAIYLILLKMIFIDNVIARSAPNVAYDAHLAGYAFGIASMLLLLICRLLESSQFDLWTMMRRWNVRRQYRDMVNSAGDLFTGGQRKRIRVKQVKKTPAQQVKAEEIMQIRGQIATRIGQGNLSEAAEQYLELMRIDDSQILARQNLLDVANQLMTMGKYEASAEAYEKFLKHYESYQHAEQVQLMLGVLYSRYLKKIPQALECLTAARTKLSDPGQLQMCEDEIKRLDGEVGNK